MSHNYDRVYHMLELGSDTPSNPLSKQASSFVVDNPLGDELVNEINQYIQDGKDFEIGDDLDKEAEAFEPELDERFTSFITEAREQGHSDEQIEDFLEKQAGWLRRVNPLTWFARNPIRSAGKAMKATARAQDDVFRALNKKISKMNNTKFNFLKPGRQANLATEITKAQSLAPNIGVSPDQLNQYITSNVNTRALLNKSLLKDLGVQTKKAPSMYDAIGRYGSSLAKGSPAAWGGTAAGLIGYNMAFPDGLFGRRRQRGLSIGVT